MIAGVDENKKLYLSASKQAISELYTYLLDGAKKNYFKDKQLSYVIQKHFFGVNKDNGNVFEDFIGKTEQTLKNYGYNTANINNIKAYVQTVKKAGYDENFDINKFILSYLSPVANNWNNKIEFLYRFFYAIQDLKLKHKSNMITHNHGKIISDIKDKHNYTYYNQEWDFSPEVFELLEIGQYCVRIGKCKVMVNKFADQRLGNVTKDMPPRIINIIDCNNIFFERKNCFGMSYRFNITPELHYSNMANAIIRHAIKTTDKGKTIHIVIPSIRAWAHGTKEELKWIKQTIFYSYANVYNEIKQEYKAKNIEQDFPKIEIQFRETPETVNEIIQNYNNYIQNSHQEYEMPKTGMSMDHTVNTGDFPSNDDSNEWFWVTAGDHLMIYGNDHVDAAFKSINNQKERIIEMEKNNCSDENFNFRTDFHKYLGDDNLWNNPFPKCQPDNLKENGYYNIYSNVNPNKFNMPVDRFIYNNITQSSFEQYKNDKFLDDNLKPVDANETIISIAEAYEKYHQEGIENNSKNHIFNVKQFGGKYGGKGCWSWNIFPSFSKTHTNYNFTEDDLIYTKIAKSNRYISAFTSVLKWAIESDLYITDSNHLGYIDFPKFLLCYYRIYKAVAIKEIENDSNNYNLREFLNTYYIFAKQMAEHFNDINSGGKLISTDPNKTPMHYHMNEDKLVLLKTMNIGAEISNKVSNEDKQTIKSAIKSLNNNKEINESTYINKNFFPDKIKIEKETEKIEEDNVFIQGLHTNKKNKLIDKIEKGEITADNLLQEQQKYLNNNKILKHLYKNKTTLKVENNPPKGVQPANKIQITEIIPESYSLKEEPTANKNQTTKIIPPKVENDTPKVENNPPKKDPQANKNPPAKDITDKKKQHAENLLKEINELEKELDDINYDVITDNEVKKQLQEQQKNAKENKISVLKNDVNKYANNDEAPYQEQLFSYDIEDFKKQINNLKNQIQQQKDKEKAEHKSTPPPAEEPQVNTTPPAEIILPKVEIDKNNKDNVIIPDTSIIPDDTTENKDKTVDNNQITTSIVENDPPKVEIDKDTTKFVKNNNKIDLIKHITQYKDKSSVSTNETELPNLPLQNYFKANNIATPINNTQTIYTLLKNNTLYNNNVDKNKKLKNIKLKNIILNQRNNIQNISFKDEQGNITELSEEQLENLLNSDKLQIKKEITWKNDEITTAIFLCILGGIPGIIYIVYKNLDIEKQNKEIKSYNQKIIKKRNYVETYLKEKQNMDFVY